MPLLGFVFSIAVGLIQIGAFLEGMEIWFDFGPLLSIFCFVILCIIPLGSIFTSIVSYVGATEGWNWEWWQAVLIIAPGLVLVAASLFFGGISSMVSAMRQK